MDMGLMGDPIDCPNILEHRFSLSFRRFLQALYGTRSDGTPVQAFTLLSMALSAAILDISATFTAITVACAGCYATVNILPI